MLEPGDVVVVDFAGATGTKSRPSVVLSTSVYHQHRPDVIVGLLTTKVQHATAPTDHVLRDWATAGLHRPSAFRSYIVTLDDGGLQSVGHLSQSDWEAVLRCLHTAIAGPMEPTSPARIEEE